MVCDNCGAGDAVVHLTQIVNNEMSTFHLCEKCAAEKGLETTPEPANFPLTDFLAQMGQEDTAKAPSLGRVLLVLRPDLRRLPRDRSAGVPALLRDVRAASAGAAAADPRRDAAHGEGLPSARSRPRRRWRSGSRPCGGSCSARWTPRTSSGRHASVTRSAPSSRQDEGDVEDLTTIPDYGLSWLEASGDHADIVLSTRVRLARNLQGHAFGPRARVNDREAVLRRFRESAAASSNAGEGDPPADGRRGGARAPDPPRAPPRVAGPAGGRGEGTARWARPSSSRTTIR